MSAIHLNSKSSNSGRVRRVVKKPRMQFFGSGSSVSKCEKTRHGFGKTSYSKDAMREGLLMTEPWRANTWRTNTSPRFVRLEGTWISALQSCAAQHWADDERRLCGTGRAAETNP